VKQPFERIVEQHADRVLRVCRAVLGVQDADDAWSETFLAAMRAYPGLPPDANVEAWLVTIAHRKAVDATRAARRRPLPVGQVPEQAAQTPAAAPDGADTDLWEHVRALPDKQRQAVACHYVAGLPYAETAEILGGSADAARKAAADGIKSLRKSYPGAMTRGAS
jgi:RNA polymerase sigma factor (sigma-70 family)